MQKMKNRKNKGFTLIELLAVIVILAILALIAIPIVINIINDSRENAHKRSIQTYGRSVENAIAQWQSKNDGEMPKYISDYDVKTSGEKVVCDPEIKGIDGDVVDSKGNQKSKDKYNFKNGKVSKVDEEDNDDSDLDDQEYVDREYHVGELITVKGNNDQYYVISESGIGQDYVTALKAEPLTVGEVNEYGLGHVNRYSNVGGVTLGKAYDRQGYGVLFYYSNSDCQDLGGPIVKEGCKNNYDDSDIKYVVDAWSQAKYGKNKLKTVDGYSARLITVLELQQLGYAQELTDCCGGCGLCWNYLKTDSVPSWLYSSNYQYWTMSQPDADFSNVWIVKFDQNINSARVYAHDGDHVLRPVINVYKKAIQN